MINEELLEEIADTAISGADLPLRKVRGHGNQNGQYYKSIALAHDVEGGVVLGMIKMFEKDSLITSPSGLEGLVREYSMRVHGALIGARHKATKPKTTVREIPPAGDLSTYPTCERLYKKVCDCWAEARSLASLDGHVTEVPCYFQSGDTFSSGIKIRFVDCGITMGLQLTEDGRLHFSCEGGVKVIWDHAPTILYALHVASQHYGLRLCWTESVSLFGAI